MDDRERFYCVELLETLIEEIEDSKRRTNEVSLALLVEAIKETMRRLCNERQ